MKLPFAPKTDPNGKLGLRNFAAKVCFEPFLPSFCTKANVGSGIMERDGKVDMVFAMLVLMSDDVGLMER